MGDVVDLIAPRPLMVENGDEDPIYPAAGVKTVVVTLRQVGVYGGEEAGTFNQVYVSRAASLGW